MFCAHDSGIARGQTLRVATKKCMAWSCFCVKSSVFGESRFPGNSQIPDPVNIFIVFPIPAPYFGQIPNPENTPPDPRLYYLLLFKVD